MDNKTNTLNRFHNNIRTKQVFLRSETQEIYLDETPVAEWFPTDFKWISAQP